MASHRTKLHPCDRTGDRARRESGTSADWPLLPAINATNAINAKKNKVIINEGGKGKGSIDMQHLRVHDRPFFSSCEIIQTSRLPALITY